MTASPTAQRLGINNKPTADIVAALQRLAPIIVSSGYRCVKLNSVVGGARSSQHTFGQAADIRTVSDRPEDNKRLRNLLIKLNLPYDQLIDEYGCDWLHVSHRAAGNRGQILSAKRIKGKTVYTPGVK